MKQHIARVALVLVSLVTAAACGSSEGSSFDVGLQKVALDLAFKDETLAKDAKPKDALGPLPVEAQAELAGSFDLASGDLDPEPLPIIIREECPKAPPDAVPPATVSREITTPVKEGRYIHREEGEFGIEGPIPLKGKLPPYSIRDYVDAKAVPQPDADTLKGEPIPTPAKEKVPDHHVWSVVQPLGATDYIKREFEATDVDLLLTKLTYKIGDATLVFAPDPAITIMELGADGGEDASWEEASTDPDTGVSMVVQGKILDRELVDACGKVYEAYKVQSTERIVGLFGRTAFTSTTDDAGDPTGAIRPGLPNVYWVATQYGGQFIKEETHQTISVGGTIISVDGTSTVMNMTPAPVPPDQKR